METKTSWEIWELLSSIPELDEVEPIPIPENKVKAVERFVEVLLVSLSRYKDQMTSPFVYQASNLAEKGWRWKKFGSIPFSLPPISDIQKMERLKDERKKRRKRELGKVISQILSPPKISFSLRFKVNRTKEGVFYTTTSLYIFRTSLLDLLQSYGHLILGRLLSGQITPEFQIPESIIPFEGEPFTEGFATFFSLPPFAILFVKVPKDYPTDWDLSLVSKGKREMLDEFSLCGEKFWVLRVKWDGEIEPRQVYGRLRELVRYFRKRFRDELKD